ncbi:MAG: 16S rRNA (uracil(1498)-N(3))-methyltransferase [Gammaproteobacteria bacterium]|nr:16S rRNA (uracil(1498)-N(3))-methyltransferase [Gammaproteobacteria bacterium]
MSLRRIHSDQPLRAGASATLDGDAANHILRVLRLRRGDRLVVFDGSGCDYDAGITALTRDTVTVALGAGQAVHSESALAITLLQGICRGSRMDTVIQKATELGVTRIQPVLTARSVVRIDEVDQAARKQSHWQRIAVAAAEQSGRSRVPEVSTPVAFDAAVGTADGCRTQWLLDPEGNPIGKGLQLASPARLLVGPEGGLTEVERDVAAKAGFTAVRLGPRILRTETAPLVALTLLQFLGGGLD